MHTSHKCVCTHFEMHINAHAHVFAPCARKCAQIFTKFILVGHYSGISLSLKFHKDPVSHCWDICKQNESCVFVLPLLHTTILQVVTITIIPKLVKLVSIWPPTHYICFTIQCWPIIIIHLHIPDNIGNQDNISNIDGFVEDIHDYLCHLH